MREERASDRDGAGSYARRLLVTGRVQGVNFRASLREMAERHGVTGWVANRPEGTVEAWLEGAPGDVEAVVSWIERGGPPAADVAEVRVEGAAPMGRDRFEVRG